MPEAYSRRRLHVGAFLLALATLASCGEKQPPIAESAPPASAEAEQATEQQAAETSAALPVASIEMPYAEDKDGLVRGYFAYPESMVEPLPAIIVIHDWMGLDASTKAVAERLAGHGYMVLAVDLFHGKTASNAQQAGELSRQLLEETDAADDNLRAAHVFLTTAAGAPVVGTFGSAMGGYWSFKSSRVLPEALAASVVWYGQVDTDQARLEAIDVPLLAVFAGDDLSMPAGEIRVFTDITQGLGKRVAVHVLPDVKQGFANADDPRFNQRAADSAWRLTLAFLAEHLRR